jgi:hypothetical protein
MRMWGVNKRYRGLFEADLLYRQENVDGCWVLSSCQTVTIASLYDYVSEVSSVLDTDSGCSFRSQQRNRHSSAKTTTT